MKVTIVVFEERFYAGEEASVKVFPFTNEKLARECFDACVEKMKESSTDVEVGYTIADCLQTGSTAYMWSDDTNPTKEDFRMELGL